MALISSVILGIAVMFAQQLAVDTEKNLRHVRIRSLLSLREGLARSLLNQSRSYMCNGGGKIPDCNVALNETFLKSQIELEIPGCIKKEDADSDEICGIVIEKDSLKYDPLTHKSKMKIIYNGADVSVANISAEAEESLNFLATAGKVIACTASHPLFNGLLANGKPDCRRLTREKCPPGSFLKSINKDFVPKCWPMKRTTESCGPNQYVESRIWVGEDNFQNTCKPLPDPFVKWP